MKTFHVVSVSIGTGILLCLLTLVVVLSFVVAVVDVHSKTIPVAPFRPQNGALGDIEKQINDLKYGPVNLEATREVKNGWLIDRMRSNRQARVCDSPASHQAICASQSAVCQPQSQYLPQSVRIVDQSDCNYSQIISSPIVGQTIVTQPAGMEMPATLPINPFSASSKDDCLPCKIAQRNAVKTGSFICSNCRKSQVSGWHTEWKSDGTPVTFLCEQCHSIMSPDQREKAYIGYLSRQSKSAGIAGLLHQEIGQ